MASSAASHKTLISSAIAWARKLEFDGIDMGWEFIGDRVRGGSPADKANFNSLVQEFRAAADADAVSAGNPALILTMAAPAGPSDIANIDLKTISDSLDWLSLMTYEHICFLNTQNTRTLNSNTAAFMAIGTHQAPILDQHLANWSFNSAINMYLDAGVPPKKIVAGPLPSSIFQGLPLYDRVWTLTDPSQNMPGSPGTAGVAGRRTGQPGYLSYFEIAEIRDAQKGTGVNWVSGTGITWYALDETFDYQWVGYDDAFSFLAKVDIINQKSLGGVMLWAIDQDTKDMNLTKTLISTFRPCTKDGNWPATIAGHSQELECPNAPGFSQTRDCLLIGQWAAPRSMDCVVNGKGLVQHRLASDSCVWSVDLGGGRREPSEYCDH